MLLRENQSKLILFIFIDLKSIDPLIEGRIHQLIRYILKKLIVWTWFKTPTLVNFYNAHKA